MTLSNYSSRTNYRIDTKLSYDEDKPISYKGWPLLVGVHEYNNSSNNSRYIYCGSNGSSTNATDIVYFLTFCIRYQRPRAPASPQLKLKMHTYPDPPDRSVSNKYSIFMQYTKKSYHHRPSTELISGWIISIFTNEIAHKVRKYTYMKTLEKMDRQEMQIQLYSLRGGYL